MKLKKEQTHLSMANYQCLLYDHTIRTREKRKFHMIEIVWEQELNSRLTANILRLRYLFQRTKISCIKRFLGRRRLLRNRPCRRIIVYHGIDRTGSTKFNTKFTGIQLFSEQIRYIKKNFHVVSLHNYFNQPPHATRPTIAITFDDGYLNNIKYALPILKFHGVPATFFITTIRAAEYSILWADLLDVYSCFHSEDIIINGEIFRKKPHSEYVSCDRGKSLKNLCKESGWDFKQEMMNVLLSRITNSVLEANRDYWELMDADSIRELSSSQIFTVGSHGYYHNNLARIPHEQAAWELSSSKRFLEEVTQTSIDCLAFPDGSYDRTILKTCDEMGIRKQLAVDYLFPEDTDNRNIENRIIVNPFIGFTDQIHSILKGTYY